VEVSFRNSAESSRPRQLQQTTLFQALHLAQHKKGTAADNADKQQQAMVQGPAGNMSRAGEEGAAGVAGAGNAPSAAGSAAANRKRKSMSMSSNAVVGDEAVNAASSGRIRSCAGSGSRRGAKVPRRAAAAVEDVLQEAAEELDRWLLTDSSGLATSSSTASPLQGLILSLQTQQAWQQLQQALSVAEGVVLGLLCCKKVGQAVQFYSSIQPLSKHQLQLLRKAGAVQKRHAAATATLPLADDDDDGGQGGISGSQAVVGIGIMPVSAEQAEAASAGLAAHPNSRGSNDNSSNNLRMFYLHVKDFTSPAVSIVHSLTKGPPHQLQQLADRLSPAAVTLLQDLLWSSSRPCVCPSAKAVLCSLSELGLPLKQLPASECQQPHLALLVVIESVTQHLCRKVQPTKHRHLQWK
jgi:hypothetical protein